MIVVDRSVWVASLRRDRAPESEILRALRWPLDADFERMESLGVVQPYEPQRSGPAWLTYLQAGPTMREDCLCP